MVSEITANLHFRGHVTLKSKIEVDASLKGIFNKIYFKNLKFLFLTGEIVENEYKPIRKQKIQNVKICNFELSYPATRVENSLCFSYGF